MILLVECCGCGMIFNHKPKEFLEEVEGYIANDLADLEQMGFTCFNCTKRMEEESKEGYK